MKLRLLIRNQPNTDEETILWDTRINTSEIGAKQFATSTARHCIYRVTGSSPPKLFGSWEAKTFGWVRWHKSVCIALIKEGETPLDMEA